VPKSSLHIDADLLARSGPTKNHVRFIVYANAASKDTAFKMVPKISDCGSHKLLDMKRLFYISAYFGMLSGDA
jgi:hypothetical protein